MQDQKNLVIAIVLSVVILLGFQMLFPGPPPEEASTSSETVADGSTDIPSVPASDDGQSAVVAQSDEPGNAPRDDSPRLPIDTGENGRLIGSVALVGGRIDDLTLADYRETVDPESPKIRLLAPPGAASPYFAEFGWAADEREAVGPTPGPQTEWSTSDTRLSPGFPITLTWDNGEGLHFTRKIAIDENFMFAVTQSVANRSDAPVTLHPYGRISRTDEPTTLGFYILHEGPLGVFNGTLKEVDYSDLRETPTIEQSTTGGWIGITDKFWLAALVPDQQKAASTRFHFSNRGGRDKFQVDYLLEPMVIPVGGSADVTNRLFAGAKEVALLDEYAEQLGIINFDLSVDFGWFFYLTKPLFYVLHSFYGWFGNFGLAILGLTVIIKLIFFPLANKSYTAMSKLKTLQPQMMELREKYSDDKQKLNAEVMALYKREKANPMAGCLPIVVQIPVFFALYKVLFVSIEMRHAPFYGWISDLSAPDPTNLFNLFGLIPFTPPDFLAIGLWPLAMGLTMFLQQKLNPAPPDPVQARVMMMLPLIFVFLFATFPAGLVLYWTWNNVLSIAQQWLIMRRVTAQMKT
ncbi:MAG: membrane protein insertase YidC [Alphaproteobacteria bacterium]